jgi:acyl carrier protein
VARGYWHREELTAERFLTLGGERFYCSGDLARLLPDGTFVFLGRGDQQVKIRGFRVELGEIEAALSLHPEVAAAVVLAREDTPGDRRLVAYVVPGGGPEDAAEPLEPRLRAALGTGLPEWMVPSVFVLLDTLPLTAHGKVDRKALPAPGAARLTGAGIFVTPHGAVEEALAAIWADLLGLERVGARDDFFALGGHSLLATQVVSRIRASFHLEIPVRSLFEEPTVRGLATAVERARRSGGSEAPPPLSRVPRGGSLPLSFAQRQLWVHDQMQPGRADYNVPFAVRLDGALDVAALAATFGEIERRHEALRTTFVLAENEPVQVIRTATTVPPCLVDLAGLPPARRRGEAQRLALAEARTPFDLGRGPLMRTTLLRLDAGEHLALLTLHHIVSDGWSTGVLLREMAALYPALSRGEQSPLPELPVQYADFAVWQRRLLEGGELEAQLGYWRRHLADLPLLYLPSDRPRPPVQTSNGRRRQVALSAEAVGALRELAGQERTTLFVPLLAGLGAVLHQISGQDDIAIGTDVANRTHQEIEGLIGFFVNQLVMRVDVSGDPTFRELLRRTREIALAAWSHQDLPFERLVSALQSDRDPSRSPLFQVKLVLQNSPAEILELPRLTLGLLPLDTSSAKYDLLLNLADVGDGVAGALEYNTDLFDEATVERWFDRLRKLLRNAADRPDERLSEILAIIAVDEEGEGRTRSRKAVRRPVRGVEAH